VTQLWPDRKSHSHRYEQPEQFYCRTSMSAISRRHKTNGDEVCQQTRAKNVTFFTANYCAGWIAAERDKETNNSSAHNFTIYKYWVTKIFCWIIIERGQWHDLIPSNNNNKRHKDNMEEWNGEERDNITPIKHTYVHGWAAWCLWSSVLFATAARTLHK